MINLDYILNKLCKKKVIQNKRFLDPKQPIHYCVEELKEYILNTSDIKSLENTCELFESNISIASIIIEAKLETNFNNYLNAC